MAEEKLPLLPTEDMGYLEDLTAAVVEASRVREGEKVGDIGPNVTGGTLIRPGGRACYPAFWIRDYAMSLCRSGPAASPSMSNATRSC